MSDSDDNVIRDLQAKQTRPRRQAPTRRPSTASPTQPAIARSAIKPGEAPPSDERAETPNNVPETAKQPAPLASTHTPKTSPTAIGKRAPIQTVTAAEPAPDPQRSPLRVAADEPTANYAVRVRRSFDDLIAWRIAELRHGGTRTSKVELTEMLLWELGRVGPDDIVRRLEDFRTHSPR